MPTVVWTEKFEKNVGRQNKKLHKKFFFQKLRVCCNTSVLLQSSTNVIVNWKIWKKSRKVFYVNITKFAFLKNRETFKNILLTFSV